VESRPGDQILHGLLEFGRVRVVLDEHYAPAPTAPTAPTKPMKSGERLERGSQRIVFGVRNQQDKCVHAQSIE
jgi:hypothetical protein